MTAAADWAAVGRRLRSRINDLKLTKAEVSRLSGISPKTLTGYMDGEPIVRRDKERSLCRAVDWSDDSIERLRRGEEPIAVARQPEPAADGDLAARLTELERWRAEWEPILIAAKEEMAVTQAEQHLRRHQIQAERERVRTQAAEQAEAEAQDRQRRRRGA
jgi:transcriptional regulator with XRE-family HTH domain